MRNRVCKTLAMLGLLSILMPVNAQITEEFEDGSITDGSPIAWNLSGPRASSELMDGAFRIAGDVSACCPGITADVEEYQDIRIETTLQYLGGGYAGFSFRQKGIENYWAGLQDDGQLFIGHNVGGVQFLRSGVYLPSGNIGYGDTIRLDLRAVGTELELTAWDTEAGVDLAATISYNDTANVRPDGNRLGVNFNPNRPNSDRVVDVLSLTYTLLDFDCDGNGLLDVNDLNCSIPSLIDSFLAHTGRIPGDANDDGTVAFDDFLLLSAAFGAPGSYTEGDFDLSGTVDFSDFLILSANFGQASNQGRSVPEPGSHCIALVSALAVSCRRRRRGFREALDPPNPVRSR